MDIYKLYIVTTTYNRGYILSNLIESLEAQTNKDFKWIVVDDASTDDTIGIIRNLKVSFEYEMIALKNNIGKMLAMNEAMRLIPKNPGCWIFSIDSDDRLYDNRTVDTIIRWIEDPTLSCKIAAVSGTATHTRKADIKGKYIEISNLDRKENGIIGDMAEIYRADILKRYPFTVWPGEKFAPEGLVYEKIAVDGYYVRFYKRTIVGGEYMDDGLTSNSWKLERDNPMGFALWNEFAASEIKDGVLNVFIHSFRFVTFCILAKNYRYIFNTKIKLKSIVVSPMAFVWSVRRRIQYRKYIK